MNPINASSLLHFTKGIKGLKGILENGFRYSYCCEEFSQTIVANEILPNKPSFFRPCPNLSPYIAIPMICFCDIPLTRSKQHSNIYGKFIIGLDKDMAISLYRPLLNPVLYKSANSIDIALADISVIQAKVHNIEGCHNIKRSIYQILGNTKPYKGEFNKNNNYCFYNEREWRILMPYDYDDTVKWHWNITLEEFEEKKKEYNKTLHNSPYAYVGFVEKLTEEVDKENFSKLITHIVVDKDNKIPQMVDFILDPKQQLFRYKDIPEHIRKIIASKITSFERIEKDF